jgi:hypothetical protein
VRPPLSESERHAAYEVAAAHLPPSPSAGRVWTDREVDVLRKACAARFNEDVRTETLLWIARAALRIGKSWENGQ